MSKKSVEIRCPNILTAKDREIKCNRFLANLSELEIQVKCPKCGAFHSIIRDEATGKIRMQQIPKAAALISPERKE